MAETKEDRKARLEAELAQLDRETEEEQISAKVDETSLRDVISHLVTNSTGYPTHADRAVHYRAVQRHFDSDSTPVEA